VSDLKVEQKQTLSREEAARLITALAQGLGAGGKVAVQMGSSTLQLSVAGQVDCELEVTVDGDEIELELELKWSTSGRASAGSAGEEAEDGAVAEDEPAAGGGEQDDADGDTVEDDDAGQGELEAGPAEQDSAEEASTPDVSAADQARDRAVPADRTPRPRRGRRGPGTDSSRSTSNGVDTAAVRAWAATNGLTVSPRGRIKDEVLQAYRDAGN
jgi:amphi-Trp domain-containing protein